MPLSLPTLDDRSYADLLDEARALIPSLYPEWTDHNPSDPGITLIELFAWLTEMLIFRTDQVPERQRVTFLKLLNGPDPDQSLLAAADLDPARRQELLGLLYGSSSNDWLPPELVDQAVRLTVVGLRQRDRAVTCPDFEALARAAAPGIARAKCIARRDLDANTEIDRIEPRNGHISVIILPQADDPAPQPDATLIATVWQYLDERRPLTTRHHVSGPFYAPVSAEVLVARRADARDELVRAAVVQTLSHFLHPLHGGLDTRGWPFGRDIYLSELYEQIEAIPGVDYVPDIMINSVCAAGAAHCVPARQLWHDDGTLIGLQVESHQLPRAQVNPARIVVATGFVPLRLTISVQISATVDQSSLRRAIQTAIKQRFHPLYSGPDGSNNWAVALRTISPDALTELRKTATVIVIDALRPLVQNIPGVESVTSIEIDSDAEWRIRDLLGNIIAVGSRARELADVQLRVDLA
jgi:hypothetical protein